MAEPEIFHGAELLIKVGDGGDPETFAHDCLINTTRGIALSATTVDTAVPDCADPLAPSWLNRKKDTLSATLTGEGLMDLASVDEYVAWLKAKTTKNVQVSIGDGQTNAATETGAFHLTEFSVTGDLKEVAQVSLTLVSDGALTSG